MAVVDYWIKNEAWHVLVANSLQQQWVNYMWPAFSKFERKQPLPQDANTKATRRINEFDASQASSVFYTSMVGSHLAGLLSYEPEKLAAALNATAWLPYDEKQRAAIYDTNYTNFQTWAAAREKTLTGYAADETDAQQAAQAKADLPKHKAMVAAIDAAFKAVRGLRSPNLNVAPSPHCRALAEARVAERAANWPQYNAACRKLYPLIKNYRQQKIPYGRLMLSYMLGGRGGAETIDMRLEIFKDHLARYRPGSDNYDVQYVAQRIFTGGTSWHLTGGPVKDRAQLEKVAAVVEEALWQYVSRNQLPPELFEWFLGTRSGTGWRAGKLGERIAEKIITAKLLHTQPYFYNSDVNGKRAYESAACSYMWLIKAHFGSLAEKYPVARYFDDMFVEEATRTGYLDSSYWSLGGLDEEKKIVACAAKLMAGFQTLPIGYGQTFGQPSTGNNPLHIGQIPHLPGSAAVVQAADRQRLAAAAPRWYTSAQLFDWQHRALAADPQQRDAMIAAVESRWNKTRFDIYAAGRSYFRTPASEMPEGNLPADVEARKEWRKTIFAKTASYVTKLKTLPRRYPPPYLYSIIKIDPDSITAEELDVLLSLFPGATPPQWPSGWGFDVVATCIQQGLINLGRGNELIPIAPEMWRITRNSTTVTNFVTNQVAFANMLTEQSELYGSELALAFASSGVEVMKSKLPVSDRIQMAALRNVNLSNVGGVIPVRKSDPRYPIFAAQTAYLTGRQEAAWKLYLGECKPKKLIDDAHRDLDPSFSIWLIDRCSETEDFDEATRIAQQMLVWFDSVPAGIDPEARARLMLSYATIAMEQKEFPRARAQFSRVVAAREFNGTRSQAEAELMIANVDRLQGRYDSAIEIIDKIIERDDPTIQAEAYLNLARVKFDQEELQEAKESLEKVFQREPEHPTGRILEGQVNLAMKKIEEAVELEIGSIALQRLIVPGKPLKVGLEDKNLSVVGKSTDVEIRAWTKSGDEEFFSLLPYGDSKTKFRGQIDTELAAINKGDGVLQVLGKDEVNYDFSERFKQRQKITFDKPLSLSVATDAALYASSGAIRTSEELEAQALEDLIRTRVGDPGPANITSQVIKPLSARRPENQVKPGNRVNLRVIDPDHSTTPGIDQLTMRLKAKSGDRIEKFTLTETSEYSGVFEGSVETRPGQPVAYASDSQEDRDPNFAISPKEYPTWVGLGDGIRPKHFSIDLNDNVSVDQMTVIANQPGNRLKKFTLEVSIDGKKFQT
ncbi:MAG: hypothetical protein VX257_06150, partial [Planctomycetota bacterium]|nr:hypothetical protein [Planctomycetota bacterium]